jgi:hypothetical protein
MIEIKFMLAMIAYSLQKAAKQGEIAYCSQQ